MSFSITPRSFSKRSPRAPSEGLFAHGGMALTLFYGFVIAMMTLAAFLYSPIRHLTAQDAAISFDGIKAMLADPNILMHAQTYAFVTLGTSQLFHAIGMRNIDKSIFRMNHLANKTMILAFVVGLALGVGDDAAGEAFDKVAR
ncbi:MAG: cation transporting ATPase C-terminal domain-containing protein, partial [Slackia piriformis]|nr:cation transporting ATPase C-terminal domain-containing protein [Slackia piriformis]